MVKIRLARRGRKKLALYDIVVADARAPRDGRFIEKVGTYNPNTVPASMELKEDRALKWLLDGAKPTNTVKAILSYKGVLYKKHLQVGVIKGAITQEQADERYAAWKDTKDSKIGARVDKLTQEAQSKAQAKLEAEAKVKEARAAAIKKKLGVEEENTSEEAGNTEETAQETNSTEEAPAATEETKEENAE